MRYILLVLLLASLMVQTSTAFAESTWTVLKRFGVTGGWARSCNQPPGPNNYWQIIFQNIDGRASKKVDRGPDGPTLMDAIESAEIVNSTTIRVRTRNDDPNYGATNGKSFDSTMVKESDHMRTIESIDSDGVELAKDGINISSKEPTHWIYKCRD